MTEPLRPITWTIAGSDSGGGAGIQADIKTMNALGTHACSVITALTAQNTLGVAQILPTPIDMLIAQIQALQDDLPPVALKLGMLGMQAVIQSLVPVLPTLRGFKVCDPVLKSTSGASLLASDALTALIRNILPHIDLLTPNLAEAEILLNRSVQTTGEMLVAAKDLLKLGPKSVLLKGGHCENAEFAQDVWTDGTQTVWFTSPWQYTQHTHGTGCTLSAAITACIALGYSQLDAIVIAKAYVNQGLRLAPKLGQGHGPLAHLGWPMTQADLPWLNDTPALAQNRPIFLPCNSPQKLGFYPIIDRVSALKRLLPLGVTTAQLRIKDLSGDALEDEVAEAIRLAKQYDCRLFINDYWALAVKHQAYGVHLGQEDLQVADIEALSQAKIRLGISTHCYEEVARALAYQPSYMAIGPVFETTTKVMRFAPQGMEALNRWRKTLEYPLVAIGGMFLENAPEILATGVDAIAVVRDITQADNLTERVDAWLTLWNQKPVAALSHA